MTPLRRTVLLIMLSVASATMPIHAAEAAPVRTAAVIERETLSRTIGDAIRAIRLDDGIKLAATAGSTPGHISTSRQLQPTNLKKVSLRTAIILTAVVIAAVYVTLWLIAASNGIYDVSNTAARPGRSAVVPIRPISR